MMVSIKAATPVPDGRKTCSCCCHLFHLFRVLSSTALGTGQAQAAPITAQAQQAFQGLDPNLKIALALAVVYLWWILS